MIRLVIARHGNTFEIGEQPRRVGRREDLPLTAAGVTQAECLGRHLAVSGWQIASIRTAPLRRCRRTAEIVAAALRPSPDVLPESWLSEIDHGPDEGRSEAETIARVGQAALDDWDRYGRPPPGWVVDPAALESRWHDALSGLGSGTHLFVTSNGVARFAATAFGGESELPSLKLRTGAFGVVTCDGGITGIEQWNRRPSGDVP